MDNYLSTLTLPFFMPPDQDLIEREPWTSKASNCSCLDWDGTREYEPWPTWDFEGWGMEDVFLENTQWTEEQYGAVYTYSLTCIANCDF